MTADMAAAVAEHVNEDMGACVLGLYRSAAQPALAKLGEHTEVLAATPGLMINAEDDHYVGTDEQAQQMADRAGATVVHLSGVGHWWMGQDPAAGAAALQDFWASI